MNILEKYLTRNPCYQANVNKMDSRYVTFQERGPLGLMLHSVGCAQPSAEAFWKRWNNESYDRACVHAFIDATTGDVWQCMPWNFRAWHCGSGKNGSANNTHVGVEMCESKWISYYNGYQFEIIDRTKAVEDCVRAYKAAVELFAHLCILYSLDPDTAILSHKEGSKKGIASDHGDPEHYWTGLGMNYTMNTFRAAVKQQMKKEDVLYMTEQELRDLIDDLIDDRIDNVVEQKVALAVTALVNAYSEELDTAIDTFSKQIDNKMDKRFGPFIVNVDEIKSKGVRKTMQKLLDAGAINGGTNADVNPNDINMDYELVRVMAVNALYSEMKAKEVEDKITLNKEEEN